MTAVVVLLLMVPCWSANVAATAFTACSARSRISSGCALSSPSIRPRDALVELAVSPFVRAESAEDVSASRHRTYEFFNRRTFLNSAAIAAAPLITALAAPPALADQLLLTDKDALDVPPFKGGVEEAKERFIAAMKEIDSLLVNYDEITRGGNGDNVRLYLGTQGVKSHMYGIVKAMGVLKDESEDIVEYTDAYEEFQAYLYAAEGAAYQSLFAEHSSAKSTPESLVKLAKGDILQMRENMKKMAGQLGI